MQIEKGFTDNCLECKVEIAEQTHPSDTIVAGDLAWWSRPSMFPGKKAEKLLPASAQEQAQVQPELEEGS